MKPPILRKYEIYRGDFWGGAVINLRNSGGASFWDGFVVRGQLRRHPDDELLHEFVLDPVVTEVSGVGILTLTLQMEPSDSEELASGRVVGDIEVESDHLPKTTLVGFRGPLLGDVTHTGQTPAASSFQQGSQVEGPLGMETLNVDVTVGPLEEVNITVDVGGEIGPKGPTGAGYGGTSATDLEIGTGSMTLTTQAGLAYVVGTRVRIASTGTAATWMEGDVTAYTDTSLTVLVDSTSGFGTHADWTLSVAGIQGEVGGFPSLPILINQGGTGQITAAAAVNALGGATSTGTGGLVRLNSATITGVWNATVATINILTSNIGGNINLTGNLSLLRFGSASDAILSWKSSANLRQGGVASATPIPQTFSVQSVAIGTLDTPGADRTFEGSRGTGSGVGGAHKFDVAPPSGSSTAQNPYVTAFTVNGDGTCTFAFAAFGITAAPGTDNTQLATTAFVLAQLASTVAGLLEFKGSIDASANPNYPVGQKGDTYYINVAGKIGGASGKSVDVGDAVIASLDNAGGTEAAVGTSWFILEHNLTGALLSANNLSDVANAATAVNNLGGATSTGTGGLVRLNSATITGVWNATAATFNVLTFNVAGNVNINGASSQLRFGTSSDTILSWKSAANLRQGGSVSATPIPQTFSVQSVAAGTLDTPGADRTFEGSRGTGSGVGGAHKFDVAPPSGSSTAQNPYVTAFTINGDGTSTFAFAAYGITAAPGTDNTQLATTAFVQAFAATISGAIIFKGSYDTSGNPLYPSATIGDAYYVSVAGKFGGASGKSVDIGDLLIAKDTNPGGTEASVGTNWFVLEHNLVGAMVGSNNLSEITSQGTARTNLGLGTLATQSGTFTGTHSGTSSGTNTGDQTISLTGDVTGSGTGSFSATIATAAVTLAKMADLAQDQFIGRTTASTGVPQTATITSAARTVLDDTTVSAMVDTLGGASAQGSGGIVRATSPTLTTPVLGVATATSLNGLIITTTTGTLTVTNGKIVSFSNQLTFAGTDSTTMTFPTTSATIARTDAAQAFTGVQTFGAIGAGFQIISTTLSLYVSFGARVRLADGLVVLPSNGTLRFWSGTNLDTGAADTFLGRKAAANIQLGVDAASPVNQTISGPSGVGSDKVGGNLTIEGGASTGTGRGGDLSLKTAISSTTGSTANSLSTRLYNSAKFVDLTEATATQFASITIAAATYIGLRVACTVFASDGTDHQALDTEFTVSAVNKAGTLTISAVTQYDGAVCNSAGTLTPVTYTAVASGNNLLLKCAATSSLTQTTLRVKWSILSCNSNDVATVTPS